MKKFLVLSLVLGIASLATATISMTVDKDTVGIGEVARITVYNTVSTNWLGYIIVQDDGSVGALSNPTKLTAMSAGLAVANPYDEAGWGYGYDITTAGDAPALPAAGAQWSFDFVSDALGFANISLWDGAGTFEQPEGGNLTVNVVPEPATLALLGLGALVLRRKK